MQAQDVNAGLSDDSCHPLQELLLTLPNVLAIIIMDREGVILSRAFQQATDPSTSTTVTNTTSKISETKTTVDNISADDKGTDVQNSKLIQTLTEIPVDLFSSVSLAMEQAGKMKLGPCEALITQFASYHLVHIKCDNIIASLIVQQGANLGLVLSRENYVRAFLNQVG